MWGSGVILRVNEDAKSYPLCVRFADGIKYYTEDGRYDKVINANRTLYPKGTKVTITEPAKKIVYTFAARYLRMDK
jgi:hypothetical protein